MKLKIKYYTFLAFLFFTPSSFAQEFRYDQDLSEIQYHTVEEGDNLYDIINLFNLGWDETLKANPDIDDPDLI